MTTTQHFLNGLLFRLTEGATSLMAMLRPIGSRFQFVVSCKARELHAGVIWQVLKRFTSRPMSFTPAPALIIAPHQDDETLGCGGLIALKRELGAKVTVVFMTDGASAPVADKALTPGRLVSARLKEAAAALAALGVPSEDVHFLDQADGKLDQLAGEARRAVEWRLAEVIRTAGAQEIYLPHRFDAHPDHEATFDLTRAAIAIAGSTARRFQYIVWMTWLYPLFWRVHPRELRGALRVDIKRAMGKKCGAIGAYPTQVAMFPPGFLNRFLSPVEIFFPVNDTQTDAKEVQG